MKILIFSDSHLSLPFDEKKYRFLSSIIQKADKIIINGDFWEGFYLSFDEFIKSPWKKLFPLLKERHAVYLYGNHDKEMFADNRMELFSDVQGYDYTLTNNDITYVFEHGNRLLPLIDETLKIKGPAQTTMLIYEWIEGKLLQIFGTKILKFYHRNNNKILKKKIAEIKKPKHIYVFGHTHYAERDLKNQFVDTGFIKHGIAQYAFIENGEITLYNERYR